MNEASPVRVSITGLEFVGDSLACDEFCVEGEVGREPHPINMKGKAMSTGHAAGKCSAEKATLTKDKLSIKTILHP